MNAEERDELLIRIDERVKALKDGDEGDVPDIKKHVEKQNGRLRKLEITVASLITALSVGGILEWRNIINIFGG